MRMRLDLMDILSNFRLNLQACKSPRSETQSSPASGQWCTRMTTETHSGIAFQLCCMQQRHQLTNRCRTPAHNWTWATMRAARWAVTRVSPEVSLRSQDWTVDTTTRRVELSPVQSSLVHVLSELACCIHCIDFITRLNISFRSQIHLHCPDISSLIYA